MQNKRTTEGWSEVTEAQIKHMVDRFLGWRLPEDFNPDGGISFKKTFNDHTAHPMKNEPVGTNLFDAMQATAMVRHMIEGAPDTSLDALRAIAAMEGRTFAECSDAEEIIRIAKDAIAAAERT